MSSGVTEFSREKSSVGFDSSSGIYWINWSWMWYNQGRLCDCSSLLCYICKLHSCQVKAMCFLTEKKIDKLGLWGWVHNSVQCTAATSKNGKMFWTSIFMEYLYMKYDTFVWISWNGHWCIPKSPNTPPDCTRCWYYG